MTLPRPVCQAASLLTTPFAGVLGPSLLRHCWREVGEARVSALGWGPCSGRQKPCGPCTLIDLGVHSGSRVTTPVTSGLTNHQKRVSWICQEAVTCVFYLCGSPLTCTCILESELTRVCVHTPREQGFGRKGRKCQFLSHSPWRQEAGDLGPVCLSHSLLPGGMAPKPGP